MTKPLNTQNEWIILTLIGAVAGFCLVPLDVKEKYTNQIQESIERAESLNTQNEWIILMLIGAVAGFCLVSLDVVVCTLSLHAEGPLCKSWKVVHID